MTSSAEPASVTSLADELTDLLFDLDPMWPPLLGLEDSRAGLGDPSAPAEAAHRAALLHLADRAAALEPADSQDRVTRDVIVAQARAQADQIEARLTEFTITDMFVGPASSLLTLLPMLPVGTPEAGCAYLARLGAVPQYLDEVARRHRSGVEAGRTPVAHLVQAAADHIDRYLAAPGDDPLRRQDSPDPEFAARRDALLADVVRPAFARYRDVLLTEILDHGRPEDRPGLCHLPDGGAVYSTLARLHTTTDRTPEELHETGLECLASLREEYAEIGRRVFGTSELGEIFERLRTDPALRWTDAEELLDTARAAIVRAEREAPRWFGTIPQQPWVVEPVPEADAPGAPAAYYLQPAADGSRPGTYFANTHEVTERFRHTAEVLAFHEVIPGHHFQLSAALSLTELPLLRRISNFNAYTEGWGLYTERLAHEMGLYSDDVSLLGMLSVDSMRAGRLVVDTGLHAKGWSRRQAIGFLERNTPMPMVEIVAEVDRYIAYPGQALSYMVGRLELQRLRADAERALGDAFDIRAFHDLVIGAGALPLTVLETVVREWTDQARVAS